MFTVFTVWHVLNITVGLFIDANICIVIVSMWNSSHKITDYKVWFKETAACVYLVDMLRWISLAV